MLDSNVVNDFVGEDVIFSSSMIDKGKNHSLHTIFGYLAQGWSSKKIRKENPDILPETITMARGIMIARNAEHFPDTKVGKPFQDFKALIDENISPEMSGYLSKHFKQVAHVNDVGLMGKEDELVWQWAINNSYDIVFTKDKVSDDDHDLTFIAKQDAKAILRAMDQRKNYNITLSALPILVHLPGDKIVQVELEKLLEGNKEEFFNYLDNRATPYIDVKAGKISCGPTYFELRGENHIEDSGLTPEQLKRDKREMKERFKAMWLSQLSVEEIRNMTPKREKKIDDQIQKYVDDRIKAAVGMGGREPQFS